MAPNPNHFGRVLRRHRRANELTQAELANRSGVSLGTVRAAESGRGAFWQTLAVLAQVLGIKFSDLVKEAEALADHPPDAGRCDRPEKALESFQAVGISF